MKQTNQTPMERWNEQFERYLLQTSYSRLKRPCDNPHFNFKLLRVVKPHGVSYSAFEVAVGHVYRKTCNCVMCISASKGQVIGILPEPVDITQKIKRRPLPTMAIAKLPEPLKQRIIIPIQFAD